MSLRNTTLFSQYPLQSTHIFGVDLLPPQLNIDRKFASVAIAYNTAPLFVATHALTTEKVIGLLH